MDASQRHPALPLGLLALAALVVVLAGASALRGLIGPTFLALILVIVFDPVRAALERLGVARPIAETARMLLILVVLLALVWAFAASLASLAGLLPGYARDLDHLIADIESALAVIGVDRGQVGEVLRTIDIPRLLGGLQPIFGGATSVASALLLIVGVVFFAGLEGSSLAQALGEASAPSLSQGLHHFARRTRRFFVVSTLFGLVVAAIDVLILIALGIPAPLVWGLLAFVTNYVPNVGFVIGLAPPALLALLGGGPAPALGVLIAYSVVNFVLQSLVQPKVVGEAVDLTATATFLSLVFWTIVLGPLGGLLAVPLTLFVDAVFLEPQRPAPWLSALLHGRAASTANAVAADAAPSRDPRATGA